MRLAPRSLSSLALIPLLLTLTGCPGDGGKGIGRVDQSSLVEVITADDAKNLDPHTTSDGGEAKLIVQIYQTLVRPNPKDASKLQAELAESWKVSEDNATITFQIRKGVTFHDGAKLDAAGVKLNLERLLEQGFKLPRNPYGEMFHDVKELKAEGHVLTVTLKAPLADLFIRNLCMFAASMVSPKVLEASKALGAEEISPYVTKHAAGTGPYKLDQFDPNANVKRLTAYEVYWGGKPKIKTLVFKTVSDETQRTEQVKKAKGVFFCDDLPREHWDEISKLESLTLHSWWGPNVGYLGINAAHDKTKSLALRKAMALAIDRDKVLEHYDGKARASYSLVSQVMPEYDPKQRCPDWSDDRAERVTRAKALLKEAGLEGHEFTIYFPNQPRPYLPRPTQIANTLNQQLNEIGLKVTIKGEDKSVLFPGLATGKYETVLIGWTTDNGHADNFYALLADGAEVGKPATNNTSRVVDPVVHEKVVAARYAKNEAERVAAYREVERLLQSRVCAYVPLVNTKIAVVYSKRLEGVEVDLYNHYRFHDATLKAE